MVGVYARSQWCFAVLFAAFWGWMPFGLFDPVSYMLSDRVEQGLNRLLSFSVVGLPIAMIVSFIVVSPALRKLMQRSVGFARAATWGFGVSTVIVVISILWGRFNGWIMSMDDTRSAQIGGGDYIRSIDGILTPYGWTVLAQNSASFIAWCTLGAVLIRGFVGPGRAEPA